MNKYLLCVALVIFSGRALAQDNANSTISGIISGLSVPASPAFSITDINPTLVQNPATPKSFALGIAQSYQQSGTGFPNNYSAEFAPVWWINPKGLNIYSYLGLPLPSKNTTTGVKENIFAGIKFTTISVAFINKDLIPDTSKATQNIFSLGVHTTLIKIYGNKRTALLAEKINQWEKDALNELNANANILDEIARLDPADTAFKTKKKAILKKYAEINTPGDFKSINELIAQKPFFAWDFAAAWAVYGVNSQTAQTGRIGAWTSAALNIPIGTGGANNYFNLNALGRYIIDNFYKNDNGVIGRANNFDTGGNIGFEFNKLSLAVESLYRFSNGAFNTKNRTVGIISVKLTDNIFVNGTFGKDFAGPNKLISSFGVNWGFGKEKVSLP